MSNLFSIEHVVIVGHSVNENDSLVVNPLLRPFWFPVKCDWEGTDEQDYEDCPDMTESSSDAIQKYLPELIAACNAEWGDVWYKAEVLDCVFPEASVYRS